MNFDEALDKALQQEDWSGKRQTNIPQRKASITTALQWEPAVPMDETLCRDGLHHFLAPSFFKTLTDLTLSNRSFTVVLRTFGTDLEEVQAAINSFAEGRHPRASCQHPDCHVLALPSSRMWVGRYGVQDEGEGEREREREGDEGGQCSDKKGNTPSHTSAGNFSLRSMTRTSGTDTVTVTDTDSTLSEEWVTDEEAVLAALELRHLKQGTVACGDHYHWWRQHNYSPWAGKPLWITENDDSVHHIFFDDNIHNCANDSIVAVRWRERVGDPFQPLSGEATRAVHGLHTVRVQSCEAYLDEDYFLKRIAECEQEWTLRRQQRVDKVGQKQD